MSERGILSLKADLRLERRGQQGEPVSGRIGLWSKADSYMHFADYTVTSAN